MSYIIFIIPLISVFVGFLMYKYPPKKINYFIGYRTFRLMKNEKVWKFANQYCGKLWLKIGIAMSIVCTIIFIPICFKMIEFSENTLVAITLCEICTMLISVFIVERKIKQMV